MPMAGVAQTGLGPGTVALSWKVFILVTFYTHERLGICTAQPGIALPESLQKNLDGLIRHFCTAGCASEPVLKCGSDQRSPNPLCAQICISESCKDNCWLTASPSRCYANQDRVCSYSNANVCQFRNGNESSTCVYTSSSEFCICQYMSNAPYVRCEPSQFIGSPVGITTVQATQAQAITEQATTSTQATTEQATTTQATTEQATTTQATTEPATTAQATTEQATTTQTTTAQAATEQEPVDNEINVAAISLGSLFALLLLLVILHAVTHRFRRQGRLPSSRKRARKSAELSSFKLEGRSTNRRLLPDAPIPDGSKRQLPEPQTPDVNAEYACIPNLPTVKPSWDFQAYACIQEKEGGSHNVGNGHEYEEQIQAAVEVADSQPGICSRDGIKNTYFCWIPTVGHEVENKGSEAAGSQVTTFTTGVFPQKGINTSFQLTHTFQNITPGGYEVPVVKPTPVIPCTQPLGSFK